jgi:hypothetical protein
MFARFDSGLAERYVYMASAAGTFVPCDRVIALDSSLRKTIMIEEEFVRKSRKVSAGLFLDKFWEMERRNLVSVWRDAAGKVESFYN